MDAKMNGLQINCPKKVERSFFLSLITNRKIMNEDYFKFYIDSLEVFAIQKWENLKINQKTAKLTKIKYNLNLTNFIIKIKVVMSAISNILKILILN